MSEAQPVQASNDKRRILVIEDDPSILLGLKMNLTAEGYEVGLAGDGALGFELARNEPWDAIILDVMLPRLNGFEVVKRLRAAGVAVPVLMLSAKSAETDKVMGLELGAEDYITKPFGVAEVLARIRVALRRKAAASPPTTSLASPEQATVRMGDVEVDRRVREVRRKGEPVDLTATEFDVLGVLIDAEGAVLSRQEIFARVWGPNHHGTPRTIDNFVAQLRAKLEEDPTNPGLIVTVRGVGYRLTS